MNPKISIFHYANLAPVRALGCPKGFEFIYQNPREAAESFNNNTSVAAPIPIGALPGLTVDFEYLGEYGVAASEKVGSVMLYSQIKFEDLTSNSKIYLTDQSATSIQLLYILFEESRSGCHIKCGMTQNPTTTENIDEADAVLIIGDDALTFENKNKYAYCYDLVTLWHKAYDRPFVFARWVVRRDADDKTKRALLNWLSGIDNRDDELIEQSADAEAKRLNIKKDDMIQYLKGMRRKLTDKDLEAQDFFLKKLYVRMLKDMPLGELMKMGHEKRMKKHPEGIVTYVMDTNPNYTNVCTIECSFCAFHKRKGETDAYTLTPEELAERVLIAEQKGASTVLLQGGLNPTIKLKQMIDYIRAIKKVSPTIHIHPLSPSEIDYLAKLEGKSAEDILRILLDEGIRTMPGGGAEILVDRVRKDISPRKCSAKRWLEIMEIAHKIGYKTTATMMYGHVETLEDIVEHLFALRDSQNKTGGYSSFIAWSFKPGNSPLGQKVPNQAHPAFYVRLVALSRLILDNFDHIQSSWFSESENAGCLGLMAGADDFGGILVEESVLKTAGHERRATEERVKELIKRSGFIPARRDSNYERI